MIDVMTFGAEDVVAERSKGVLSDQEAARRRDILYRAVPEPLSHQTPIELSPARFKLLRGGRRFGKTRFAETAAIRGHGPVDPVTGAPKFRGVIHGVDVVWVAQDYPNLTTVVWREEFEPRFRPLSFAKLNANEHTIAFEGLGTLFLRPETAIAGIRGIGSRLGGVILDEAAWYDLESALKDVVMPALIDNEGWLVVMSTTNCAEDGNQSKRVPSYFNLICDEIDQQKRDPALWHQFYGTAYDNPRLAKSAIDTMVAEYDSDSVSLKQEVYAQIVEPGASDQLIKREWCLAAAARHANAWYRDGEWALGVDVANSTAGDKGAFAHWRGACLVEIRAFPCPNPNKLGEETHAEMIKYGIDAMRIGIDSVGVGAGTVGEMWRLGVLNVRALNSGAKPMHPGPEKFQNLRAEMWWKMREDLRLNRIAIPNDAQLIAQLTVPRMETRNGVIRVESKEDIRERMGGKSPDLADAAVYGNYVRAVHRPKDASMVDRENQHPGYEKVGNQVRVADDRGKPTGPQWAPGPKVPRYSMPTSYRRQG